MRLQTVALAGTFALLAGAAGAQAPSQPGIDQPRPLPQLPPTETHTPAPPPGTRSGDPRQDGRREMRIEGRYGPGPGFGGPAGFQPTKGTVLKVERDGGFFLKCADEDSTKACMEAAAPVLDKLNQARQAGGSAPR